jgi:hypothetical protein
MSFHSLNNFIFTFIADPFMTVLWIANLIASYLVLYILYIYFLEELNYVELGGPISLIAKAINSNRTKDKKAFKTNE